MQKSNWKKCKLSEVATVVGGGTPKTKEPSFWSGDIPWLTPKDLSGYRNRYIVAGERYITEEGLKNSSATLLPKGTVLLTSRAPIGYLAIAQKDLTTNQGFKSLVLKTNQCPEFYYYLLKANIGYIQNMGSGSTFKEISGGVVKELEFFIPEYDEQKRIAEFLGAFDDKIELLQKQNKTLEEMAKATFKSWFVDFDVVKAKQRGDAKADIMRAYHLTDQLYDLFPSSFTDSALGPIPLGWEVGQVAQLGEVICGKTPSTSHKEYYGGDIPFITIPDMHNAIFASHTERYLSQEGANFQQTKYLPPYSTCVSCIATPGLVVLTEKISQTNQQINSVIPTDLNTKFYNYYILRSVAEQIKVQGSGGSVFGNLNKTSFSKLNILWPSVQAQIYFSQKVENIFEKILLNTKQIQTLTEFRDSLLPRLISGKIRV